MEKIKDEAVFDYLLKNKLRVRDSELHKLNMLYENYEVSIILGFHNVGDGRPYSIKFCDVQEYYIYHQKKYPLWVSHLKFFKYEGGFYISLDPYTEEEVISEQDNYCIICKSIEMVS